ncbi:MAG: replication initiator protein A, partial [Proteobacteria bacterium]|nr:replication initiator protein A [Pseudomonadota bacterium]
INRDYFRLRRPIDRRLYELARKHCGRQPTWCIGVDLLQKKCGSLQEGKHFSAHLRELTRTNHLPDYVMTIEDGKAVFHRRDGRLPDVANPPAPAPSAEVVPTAPRPRGIFISSAAIERLAEVAPGWDKYMLERLYCGWAADKEQAHSEDARFHGWVKSFTKGRAAP